MNIFDCDNLKDVDQAVVKELRKREYFSTKLFVLELFDIKDTLSLDEILVGMYRKHNKMVKRTYLQQNAKRREGRQNRNRHLPSQWDRWTCGASVMTQEEKKNEFYLKRPRILFLQLGR